MELAKTLFQSTKPEDELKIDDQSRCCLCGTELIFRHQIDYLSMRIEEQGACPCCHIQLKAKEHTLQ